MGYTSTCSDLLHVPMNQCTSNPVDDMRYQHNLR